MFPEELPEIPVYLVVTPGFMMLDLAGPAEAFRLARQFGGPFCLQLVSPTEKVNSSLDLPVCDLKPLPTKVEPEALVVVSGVENSAKMYQLPEAEQVVAWLRQHRSGEHRIATICSAAQLAARAGLLDGKRCTTHHTIIERLKKLAPEAKVEDDRVFVEDGRLYTSAGVTAGIDLALYLIEKLAGAALAQQVAREMVVYLRRSGQDPQLSPWLEGRNHLHPAIHKVQDAISQFPDRHWSLAELADIACMSVRNLSRLFKQHVGDSVLDYQQRLRVAYARQLLQATNVPIERVAEKSGFASARDFRRVWAKFEPLPPALVRQQMMDVVQ